MDTILLCGGHMDDAFVLGCIENIGPDCIIGIDRGLEFCYRNRIVPQYILGDFDSISPEVINWYRSRKEIPIREYKPEKDATDTRMGMELAMELGSDRIFLFVCLLTFQACYRFLGLGDEFGGCSGSNKTGNQKTAFG